MGEIFKRTRRDGTCGKTWWIRYYVNGKRFAESAETTKRHEAKALLARREGAKANGEPVSPLGQRYTVREALDVLEAFYEVNGRRSLPSLKRRVKLHLVPQLGNVRLARLGPAEVLSYQQHRLREGAAAGTVNRELAALKKAITLAVKAQVIHRKPVIDLLAENNVRTGFYTDEDVAAISRELPEHLRSLFKFHYYTGWRRAEALGLQWWQVDRVARVIRLEREQTKGRTARELAYGTLAPLLEIVEDRWAAHQALKGRGIVSPWVFTKPDGKQIKDYYTAWRSACERAGLPGRLVHDCRRSCARNLSRAGVSRTVAMAITGHKTESMYRRYDIVDTLTDQQDAFTKLANAHGYKTGTSQPDRASGDTAPEPQIA